MRTTDECRFIPAMATIIVYPEAETAFLCSIVYLSVFGVMWEREE